MIQRFIYDGGSCPGQWRTIHVLSSNPETIEGIDVVTGNYRRFSRNKTRNKHTPEHIMTTLKAVINNADNFDRYEFMADSNTQATLLVEKCDTPLHRSLQS